MDIDSDGRVKYTHSDGRVKYTHSDGRVKYTQRSKWPSGNLCCYAVMNTSNISSNFAVHTTGICTECIG